MFPRREIKTEQKKIIARNMSKCLTLTLVFTALIRALELWSNFVNISLQFNSAIFISFSILSLSFSLFVMPVFTQGYRICGCKLSKNGEVDIRDLFSAFSDYRRIIAVSFLYFIYVFLLSLLFVIPGIIAAYRYRFAWYVLLDSPDLTASQALKVSANLTRGFKWDLFVLDLSFFGWELLCGLTLGVLSLWILPYRYTTEAEAYHYICFFKYEYKSQE